MTGALQGGDAAPEQGVLSSCSKGPQIPSHPHQETVGTCFSVLGCRAGGRGRRAGEGDGLEPGRGLQLAKRMSLFWSASLQIHVSGAGAWKQVK